MSKCKKCYSINEETISTISRISAQMGIPESEIANKYLDRNLSISSELTSAERYHFQRNSINMALDNVLLLFGIHDFSGGLSEKYKVSLYIAHGNSRGKNREYRNGIIELSLFEILEQIRTLDINIWKEITIIMAKFGEIRKRYFYLYPKLKKVGEKEETTIYNNTITIPVTQSNQKDSVTQENPTSLLEKIEKYHPELSDEEYLKEKRKSFRYKTP